MVKHSIFLAFSASLVCAAVGCSHEPSPATDTSPSHLEQGAIDTDHTFSVGICIGGLSAGETGTCDGSACSGTLIAPNLVLTARHCVQDPIYGAPLAVCTDSSANHFDVTTQATIASVRVTTAPSVFVGSPTWHTASAFAIPTASTDCDDDLALVTLADNIPETEAKPIAADIYTDLAASPPEKLTIIGRGAITETYDVDSDAFAKFDVGDAMRRMLKDIPLLCISDTDGKCQLEDFTFQTPPNRFDLTKGVFTFAGPTVHSGDSGAGIFDQKRFDGGHPTVIGVVAYEGIDATGNSNANFGVRLTQHQALIRDAAVEAAASGHYPTPAWLDASTKR